MASFSVSCLSSSCRDLRHQSMVQNCPNTRVRRSIPREVYIFKNCRRSEAKENKERKAVLRLASRASTQKVAVAN
jgi:hypothetical protein